MLLGCVQADEAEAVKAAADAEQARVEMLARVEALVQQRLQAEEQTLAAEEQHQAQNKGLQVLLAEMQAMEAQLTELASQRAAQDIQLQEMQEKEAEEAERAEQVRSPRDVFHPEQKRKTALGGLVILEC